MGQEVTVVPGRRGFLGRVAAGLAAAAAPPLASRAAASLPAGAPPSLVQLNSNENAYGPSPRARAALEKARASASRYPDADEEALIDAIARHHRVAREEIVLGCGSSEILQMADMAFLGEGRKLVCAEPSFEAVLLYARVTRAEPVKVPLTADYRHDLPALASAMAGSSGLVYVCNPNNPTGTLVTRDELASLLRAVPAAAVVLVDEAYHHFVEDPRYASALELSPRPANVVVARTFSKIHGLAGMRLGYAVASRENADALRAHAPWNNANAAVLAAALASLDDEAHVADQRRRINGTRDRLCRELAREGRRFIPSHANFLMIDVGADVAPLIAAFRQRGLLVGRKFPSLPTFLRVSIGTDTEMQAFLRALRALVPAARATT
jgi:histidinol-phosphate aminotransferase